MGHQVRRILQVHTRYRLPGGEDEIVEAERRLLEDAGVEVRQAIFDNADLRESRSMAGDLRLAGAAIWSRSAEHRVRAEIAKSRPQVVHVHNTFPAASPSVYAAAARMRVPVVQTLHNYRFVCPAATAFRAGRVCTDCVGLALTVPAVIHACVRSSRSQSAVATATQAFHRARGTFRSDISLFLALTPFQRGLMVRGGLPANRIRVVPNFLEPDPGQGAGPRSQVAYIGRLSPEKGVAVLIQAARLAPGMIRVGGDGPLRPEVEDAARAGTLEYLGPLSRDEVAATLQGSVALVVPSIWYEGFPMVLLEGLATGTPAIASRIGSLPEIVEDGASGQLVVPGDADDLAHAIRAALDQPDRMTQLGARARAMYERRYRGADHLAALTDAYASVQPRGAPEPPSSGALGTGGRS